MGLLDSIKPHKVNADILDYKLLIAGKEKSGKAQPNSVVIPTTEGFKSIGEIKVGDFLYDRLGKPTEVLGVFPQGELDVYEVTLDDGRSFKANDEHLVPYITSKNNISEKTIKEMLVDYKKEGVMLHHNTELHKYRIPNSHAIEFEEKELPIPPYALGVMIGDGALTSKEDITISNNEIDIVRKFENILGFSNVEKSEYNYNWQYKITKQPEGLVSKYRSIISELGLNVTSRYKFIPTIYLHASSRQRKHLLQGLMDTDGCVVLSDKGSARFDFSTSSEQLSRDVKELAHSLGYGATSRIYERPDKKELYDDDRDVREYIVSIYTSDTNIVTSEKHKEKLKKAKYFSKKEEYAKIVDIKKLDYKEDMTCFYVDNREHLYITNDYIVTHNTSLAYNILKEKFDGDVSKGLFLAFERGYGALNGIHAFDIGSWKDAIAIKKELLETKGKNGYKVLVFDTVDLMETYANEYVVKREKISDGKPYKVVGDIPYGGGYSMVETEVQKYLNELDQAGYSLWYITHSKDKTFTSKSGYEYNQTVVSLGNKVGAIVKNMVDFMVFIDIDKEKNDKGDLEDIRKIYFRGSTDVEAGSRFKHLPEYTIYDTLNFINNIEDAIRAEYDSDDALNKAKKEQQQAKKEKEEVENVVEESDEDEEITDDAPLDTRFEKLQSDMTTLAKNLPKDGRAKGYVSGMPTQKELVDDLKAQLGSANYMKIDMSETNYEILNNIYKDVKERFDK